MPEKLILLILDGLGDLPSPDKTPLQMAKKPNINKLAKNGIQGLMSVLGKGIVPGSDCAHLELLGYPPEKYYFGRGPLEALGAGMSLKQGDIAFRANFATISKNKIIDRRAGRLSSVLAKKLEKEINMQIEDVKIIFKASTGHRGALILRGKDLSGNISSTDSHNSGVLKFSKPLDSSFQAKKTAKIINKFTKIIHKKLEKNKINIERKNNNLLPANIILLRGPGIFKKIPLIEKLYGIKSACVAGGALYKGIAQYIGMDVIDVKSATADKNTDLYAKGSAVQKILKKYDFVFVHIKALDNFSHDGDVKGKTKFIQKIDKELIPLLIKTGAHLVITGDHSTICKRKEHSGHEVPVLICEKGGRKDGLKTFDEITAMKGGLGHIYGKELMFILLNIIKKTKMSGS